MKISKIRIGKRFLRMFNEYIPFAAVAGGYASGVLFLDIAFKNGSGWFFAAGIFAFFYATFYQRWVTTANMPSSTDASSKVSGGP